MRLIARIPCRFAGKRYLIGEEIPAEVVENPEAQAKRGVLTVMNDGDITPQTGEVKFTIPIHLPDQDYEVSVTESELIIFTDILQMGVKTNEEKAKVTDIVSSIESENLLILIDALDGRKVVSDAVKERVDALSAESDSEPETDGEPEAPESEGDDGEPETPPAE